MILGLGVDPGLRACGMALVGRDGASWISPASRTVRSTPKSDFVSLLRAIGDALREMASLGARAPHGLGWIGIEDPLYVIAGKQGRAETDFHALRLMAVLGVACEVGFELGVAVVLVDTGDVKRAVGAPPNADKAQIQRAARAMIRGCDAQSRPDFDEHQADACGAGIASGRRMLVDGAINAAKEQRR